MKAIIVILCLSLVTPLQLYAGTGEVAGGIAAGAALGYREGQKGVAASGTSGEEYEKKAAAATDPGSKTFWTIGAIIAGASVLANLSSRNKAKDILNETGCETTNSCFNNNNDPTNPYNVHNPNNPNNNINNDLLDRELNKFALNAKKTLQEAKDKGYKFNPDGSIIDPKGNKIDSLASAADASGVGQDLVDEANQIMAEAAKKAEGLLAKFKEHDEEYAGGGGGGAGGGGYESDTTNSNRRVATVGSGTKAPTVAGLSVNHGNDKIGVAGDNIFEMIHRRYESSKRNMNPGGP